MKGPRKMSESSQARVDRLTAKYGAFTAARVTIENEIRAEARKRLEAMEREIAFDVIEMMQIPDITKVALMKAIGKQNPDRWKDFLAKWSHIEEMQSVEAFAPEVIEYEIPMSSRERKVEGLTRYGFDRPALRMFKLRTIRYPWQNKKDAPGTDRVIWDTEAPEFDSPDFGFNISNPGWGNAPNIGFGPDRDEVMSAILAWIEKNPEIPT